MEGEIGDRPLTNKTQGKVSGQHTTDAKHPKMTSNTSIIARVLCRYCGGNEDSGKPSGISCDRRSLFPYAPLHALRRAALLSRQ